MICADFFRPFTDWLREPPAPHFRNVVSFLITGNRSEANRFVLYMSGNFHRITDNKLFGSTIQLFSDREGEHSQPFDIQQPDPTDLILSVPDGPLLFNSNPTGNTIGQFSRFECRDNGL